MDAGSVAFYDGTTRAVACVACSDTGQERVGALLDGVAGERLRVLHDRRVPGSRANIDHIVVCPSGVVVVDSKRYQGRPSLAVEGGLFRPRVERLMVGRRDCTKLVDSLHAQVALVRGALGDRDIAVRGAALLRQC